MPLGHVIMSPSYKIISLCQCQVQAAQWRIVPAQNRLAVVVNVWYRSAGANPFWWIGHERVVRTQATMGGDGCLLRFWGPGSLLASTSWSNSLILGITLCTESCYHVSCIQNSLSLSQIKTQRPLYWHELTLMPSWISNHMSSKGWYAIVYRFLNFNGCRAEVWEYISGFIPNCIMHVIIDPCWDYSFPC